MGCDFTSELKPDAIATSVTSYFRWDFRQPAGSPSAAMSAVRAPRAPDHAAAEGKDRCLKINATPATAFPGSSAVPGQSSPWKLRGRRHAARSLFLDDYPGEG